ncbi:MAG: hypothetical protein ACOXZR_03015 [Bacilli bacterium]|jgi:hypothetical protein
MNKQQKILSFCPHFNEIVNCEFLEDDLLTSKLIQYYQDYIFNINEEDEEEIKVISNLDQAMYKYIEDYRFAKSLRETLQVEAVLSKDFAYLEQLMKYIIQFFNDFEKQEVRNIFQTKWI